MGEGEFSVEGDRAKLAAVMMTILGLGVLYFDTFFFWSPIIANYYLKSIYFFLVLGSHYG